MPPPLKGQKYINNTNTITNMMPFSGARRYNLMRLWYSIIMTMGTCSTATLISKPISGVVSEKREGSVNDSYAVRAKSHTLPNLMLIMSNLFPLR